MAYRIAIAGAQGPFVGPWIRSIGTEYAIEVNGAVVLEVERSGYPTEYLDLSAQQHQFPSGVSRYRLSIPHKQESSITARVHLR